MHPYRWVAYLTCGPLNVQHCKHTCRNYKNEETNVSCLGRIDVHERLSVSESRSRLVSVAVGATPLLKESVHVESDQIGGLQVTRGAAEQRNQLN